MSTPSFATNERVLCYHGPLIYEAKVLKCEVWDETNTKLDSVGAHYLVHYKGWKQTYVSPPAQILVPPSDFPHFCSFSVSQLGRVGPYGAPPQI
jgi:hypothetical protein